MRRTVTFAALACAMVLASGCTRGIKEGLGLFQGGKGSFQELRMPSTPLTSYDSIEVGRFTSGFAPAPSTLADLVGPRLTEELRKKGQPVGGSGSKTLVVRGTVTYYESASSSGHIFGPLEEAIADVELVDKAGGQVVARASCVGRSTASTSTGVNTKAEGLAEAVANWIAKYRPKKEGE